MTKSLEKIVAELNQLPDTEQDLFADWIQSRLSEKADMTDEEEARWAASFANSQDRLAKLAAEALSDYSAGRTTGGICSETGRGDSTGKCPGFGILKGLVAVPDDFDETPEDFKEYM